MWMILLHSHLHSHFCKNWPKLELTEQNYDFCLTKIGTNAFDLELNISFFLQIWNKKIVVWKSSALARSAWTVKSEWCFCHVDIWSAAFSVLLRWKTVLCVDSPFMALLRHICHNKFSALKSLMLFDSVSGKLTNTFELKKELTWHIQCSVGKNWTK